MTIINSSAAIKKYVDAQDAKKVSKTGDTMTENLTLVKNTGIFCIKGSTYDRDAPPSSGRVDVGAFATMDKDGFQTSSMYTAIYSDGSVGVNLQSKNKNASGAEVRSIVSSIVKTDGTTYAICPTPSAKNDNSTKIATTAWVNSASTLVHTTGNETIAGTKTFMAYLIFKQSTNTSYAFRVASRIAARDSAPSANLYIDALRIEDGSGLLCAGVGSDFTTANVRDVHLTLRHKAANVMMGLHGDGTNVWGYSPTPPSSAKGTEIATAAWVNAKLSSASATKTTLTRPSVSDMMNAPIGATFSMYYDDGGSSKFVFTLTKVQDSMWSGSGMVHSGAIYMSVLYAEVGDDIQLHCGTPLNGNYAMSTISVDPTGDDCTLTYVG